MEVTKFPKNRLSLELPSKLTQMKTNKAFKMLLRRTLQVA